MKKKKKLHLIHHLPWATKPWIWILLVTSIILTGHRFSTPSHERFWISPQENLPFYTQLNDHEIRIENIRDFRYAPEEMIYLDRVYNLKNIQKVNFIISYFSSIKGIAHTFLSFEFTDKPPLVISVEARREEGEEYSLLGGVLNQYELMYVIGTEEDLIGWRSFHKKQSFTVYETTASPQQARKLLMTMLNRANEIHNKPEFYNLFTNNCTNNIVQAIQEGLGYSIPWSRSLFFPGYSDTIAYKQGLLKDSENYTLEELQQKHTVDTEIDPRQPGFSNAIRHNLR